MGRWQRWLLALALLAAPVVAEAVSVEVNWLDNSNNEMGFNIERKPVACAAAGTWAQIGSVGVNVRTYLDVAVVEGASYCYRVDAWNTADGTPTGMKQFSAWSNEAGATLPFVSPVPPTGLGVVVRP